MTQESAHLSRYYEGWDRYQGLLVDAVGSLTAKQLALRTAPSLRPVWQLAAHIIVARIWWIHNIMGEADQRTDLDEMLPWDEEGQPQRSGTELAEGLRESWELVAGCLERWTANDLDQEFSTASDRTRSRQWIIWHVIEHDLHHGGELFFTLGMHGLPTPDL